MPYYGYAGSAAGGAGDIAIGPDFGDGQPSASCSVGTVSVSGTTSNILAEKDTWIPNIALCPDDTNKNGTDLQVDGAVATRKDIYTGWDLASYPTGAAVTAANLTMQLATAAVTAPAANFNHISDADEAAWTEANQICSNARALTSFQTQTGFFTGVGEKTVALNATALTRIGGRMGAGSYSIIVIGGTTQVGEAIFESADQGTNDNLGPRLTFAWNKTL